MGTIKFGHIDVEWLGHASFKIRSSTATIYTDPFQIRQRAKDGDVVTCSHDHYDHCSVEDIAKVIRDDGVIVAARNCEPKIRSLKNPKTLLSPGEAATVKNVRIQAMPAYNVGKRFHPREYGGVGFLMEVEGVRIYHAGDTDLIPEMKSLAGQVEVALLPVSGVYVMDVDEAVEAAKLIRPRLAIPMHYGSIVGDEQQARLFKEKLRGICEVEIPG